MFGKPEVNQRLVMFRGRAAKRMNKGQIIVEIINLQDHIVAQPDPGQNFIQSGKP